MEEEESLCFDLIRASYIFAAGIINISDGRSQTSGFQLTTSRMKPDDSMQA
jgi:hypothetical protein